MWNREEITRYDLPAIINRRGYKQAAEIGVHHGYYSYYLLRHSRLDHLVSIDSFLGKTHDQRYDAELYLQEFGKRSLLLISDSAVAAYCYASSGARFDFVYIDADHRRKSVERDLRVWYPLVRPGGLLAGHDYVEGCGVVAAVDAFAAERNLQVALTRERWATWMINVP